MSGTPGTMAYGYAIDSQGRIFCAQTFGTYVATPGHGGSCDVFGSGNPTQTPGPTNPPPAPTQVPAPTKPPSTATPSPTSTSPQARLKLRGYEFDDKPIGSRFFDSWKLPQGFMSTSISTVAQSSRLEVRVAAWWGPSTIQVMWDGQVVGTYTVQDKQVMTINVPITHGSGKHTLRLDNRGAAPISVRRARTI